MSRVSTRHRSTNWPASNWKLVYSKIHTIAVTAHRTICTGRNTPRGKGYVHNMEPSIMGAAKLAVFAVISRLSITTSKVKLYGANLLGANTSFLMQRTIYKRFQVIIVVALPANHTR